MFHIRGGGSNGPTRDKDDRFVPVYPRIGPLLEALPQTDDVVFPAIVDSLYMPRD
jgi:hypothetical protein